MDLVSAAAAASALDQRKKQGIKGVSFHVLPWKLMLIMFLVSSGIGLITTIIAIILKISIKSNKKVKFKQGASMMKKRKTEFDDMHVCVFRLISESEGLDVINVFVDDIPYVSGRILPSGPSTIQFVAKGPRPSKIRIGIDTPHSEIKIDTSDFRVDQDTAFGPVQTLSGKPFDSANNRMIGDSVYEFTVPEVV